MTEHEKLFAGVDYDYRDSELQEIMKKASQLQKALVHI
jgi:hypothetical protein